MLSLLEAGAGAQQPGGGLLSIIVMYGLIFVVFYFLLIRPQKKRQKQVKDMQESVCVGDWVMTTGGLFGKVVDTINDYLIVEFGTNKSVLIPVQRDQVAAAKEPDLTRKRVEEVIEEDDDDLDDDDFDDDDE